MVVGARHGADIVIDGRDDASVTGGVAQLLKMHGRLDGLVVAAAPSAQTLDAARNSDPVQVLDAVDAKAAETGLGPSWAELQQQWDTEMAEVLGDAGIDIPKPGGFLSTGKRGVHSEHMGFLLAEMQHLQRAYPGGVW